MRARRIGRAALVLSALATAGTLAAPAAAHAAQGTLVINGQSYVNPSGCYRSDIWPLSVDNRTNGPAYVFNRPNCQGTLLKVVYPGESSVEEFGAGVYIR